MLSYDGQDVLEAFQTWWASTLDARSLTRDGLLWHRQAPESANVLPYAVFFLKKDPVETQTTSFAVYRAKLQVNLYHDTAFKADKAGATFRRIVKGAPLSIDGETVMHVLPESQGIQEGQGLGPGGSDCWVSITDVDIPYTEQ